MRINHVLVVARDLNAMRDFFVETVGLTDGPRPPFGFPGNWLYDGDHACIHLAEGSRDGDGIVDHVAFDGDDYDEMVARLERTGRPYHVSDVPDRAIRQVFVDGPEGIKIEVGFVTADA